MTQGEFLQKLAVAEARIRSGIPPERKPETMTSLGEFASRDSIAAWGHAHDLGIFVGKDLNHHQNPVIIAICETRCGTTIYKQMAFAEEAWEYYQKAKPKRKRARQRVRI